MIDENLGEETLETLEKIWENAEKMIITIKDKKGNPIKQYTLYH